MSSNLPLVYAAADPPACVVYVRQKTIRLYGNLFSCSVPDCLFDTSSGLAFLKM